MKKLILAISIITFASCREDASPSPFESTLSSKYRDTAHVYFKKWNFHIEYSDSMLPSGITKNDSADYYANLFQKYTRKADSVKAFIEN